MRSPPAETRPHRPRRSARRRYGVVFEAERRTVAADGRRALRGSPDGRSESGIPAERPGVWRRSDCAAREDEPHQRIATAGASNPRGARPTDPRRTDPNRRLTAPRRHSAWASSTQGPGFGRMSFPAEATRRSRMLRQEDREAARSVLTDMPEPKVQNEGRPRRSAKLFLTTWLRGGVLRAPRQSRPRHQTAECGRRERAGRDLRSHLPDYTILDITRESPARVTLA